MNDKSAFSHYVRSDLPLRDFLTLIRHIVWLRLSKLGFRLRNFMSKEGEFIFTVLYSDDENLKNTAEQDKMRKALNLELSDILSLEPVDVTLRPLRLNTRLGDM